MDEEELDFADNHSVRACLQRLHILYNEITTGQYAMDSKTTLVRLALKERIAIEQDLRDRGEYSDFAPLALSAMQEALRTAINPRASGFQVEQAEIRLRFGELEPLELWQHFFEHYLGNVFEWNSNAANFPETQTTDIHADVVILRKHVARPMAAETIEILKTERSNQVDAAVRAFHQVVATPE